MTSLNDVKQDIVSLEEEINQLETQYQDYLKQLESLKRKAYKQGDTERTTTTTVEETFENSITPPKKQKNAFDDVIVPPPLEHEFFDLLITEFFQNNEEIEIPGSSNKKKLQTNVEQEAQQRETLSHINLENLYRLNGVTAFAINDPSITHTTDHNQLRQLGIRFDLIDPNGNKFLKPHYLILRKNDKNDNWEVYKKTVPEYVELNMQWLNIDMYKFTSDVRRQLIRLQRVDKLLL